jgi:hypothetical protein
MDVAASIPTSLFFSLSPSTRILEPFLKKKKKQIK